MKLSEAIRNAVDTKLAHPDMSYAEKKFAYFGIRYALDGVIDTRDAHHYFWKECPGLSLEEIAELSFMYAEFLALEAEDLEELEELQRALEQQNIRQFAFQHQEN